MIKLAIRFVLVAALFFVSTGANAQTTTFFNGFETDISGWDVFGGTYNATRVATGTNGIMSKTGSFHAEVTTAATNWGGYSSTFPAYGYETSVDIYLDLNATSVNDTRFDWSSAVNQPDGNHRRDFIFNGGFYNDSDTTGTGPRFVFSASNNSGRSNSYPKNPGRDPFAITASGWYMFKHTFYDAGGSVMACDLSIVDGSGTTIKTWTLSDPSDIIGSTVGGNRYGWFVNNEFSFLAIDNSKLIKDVLIPVELTGFTASAGGQGVVLSWATATETENLGFYVYRSQVTDGEYTQITAQMIPGQGNSAEAHSYEFVDTDVEPGNTYFYKLVDVDYNGNLTFHGPVSVAVETLPAEYALEQNFPNPFNPRTVISYQLPVASDVQLVIYNTAGQLVRTLVSGEMTAGSHSAMWDGTDDSGARGASGVYLYTLKAGSFTSQKKLVLTK